LAQAVQQLAEQQETEILEDHLFMEWLLLVVAAVVQETRKPLLYQELVAAEAVVAVLQAHQIRAMEHKAELITTV
jgi:hypothetical protein